MIEFGDYLFIESTYQVVTLADIFKTIPPEYEYLKKTHNIIGKASKQAILIGAKMNPELTIVLQRKIPRKKIGGRDRERSVATKNITYFNLENQ